MTDDAELSQVQLVGRLKWRKAVDELEFLKNKLRYVELEAVKNREKLEREEMVEARRFKRAFEESEDLRIKLIEEVEMKNRKLAEYAQVASASSAALERLSVDLDNAVLALAQMEASYMAELEMRKQTDVRIKALMDNIKAKGEGRKTWVEGNTSEDTLSTKDSEQKIFVPPRSKRRRVGVQPRGPLIPCKEASVASVGVQISHGPSVWPRVISVSVGTQSSPMQKTCRASVRPKQEDRSVAPLLSVGVEEEDGNRLKESHCYQSQPDPFSLNLSNFERDVKIEMTPFESLRLALERKDIEQLLERIPEIGSRGGVALLGSAIVSVFLKCCPSRVALAKLISYIDECRSRLFCLPCPALDLCCFLRGAMLGLREILSRLPDTFFEEGGSKDRLREEEIVQVGEVVRRMLRGWQFEMLLSWNSEIIKEKGGAKGFSELMFVSLLDMHDIWPEGSVLWAPKPVSLENLWKSLLELLLCQNRDRILQLDGEVEFPSDLKRLLCCPLPSPLLNSLSDFLKGGDTDDKYLKKLRRMVQGGVGCQACSLQTREAFLLLKLFLSVLNGAEKFKA